ncbi:hypothetical protein [Methylobacterium aerolatum]|uniref:Transposase n=1 Tax=Methylobacterium aerolatum TaxID=418708 RepID=A0ABU0HUT3_9HYPH|nr:hypothetical protein [Methylobacterium aerolatum]MDQ0446085.1 hypothetical protein [Methylobacterium aerolatum]GJD35121.1 hypothetical protein FMGBMHLM_2029 [Methylobacterium aerolatum]
MAHQAVLAETEGAKLFPARQPGVQSGLTVTAIRRRHGIGPAGARGKMRRGLDDVPPECPATLRYMA